MTEAKVVAISGPSGCGKTSVVKQLSQQLACPYLLFDAHIDAHSYPKDMKLWLQNGADFSAITTPGLIRSLTELKAKCTDPFILVEEPFGRCRESISSFIDCVVLLDIPLEICLSRVVMRNINRCSDNSLASITGYLARYDDHLRDIYSKTTERVRETSDFIIQRPGSIQFTADLIQSWLMKHAS